MVEHAAVLMGGRSAERGVSLVTGRECIARLRSAGYCVDETNMDRNAARRLLSSKSKVCINALHGRLGDDDNIQELIKVLGIPYTHSSVKASALAMKKPQAKTIFEPCSLVCLEDMVVKSDSAPNRPSFPPHFVVKPINEGSSVGVTIVHSGDNRKKVTGDGWLHCHHILIERSIFGRKLTVAAFESQVHCVTEISSDRGFHDCDANYLADGSRHILPADRPTEIAGWALNWAETAYYSLGCRGIARCDFCYDDTADAAGPEDELHFLEINTQPAAKPILLVPKQAQFIGVKSPQLVTRMVEREQCAC